MVLLAKSWVSLEQRRRLDLKLGYHLMTNMTKPCWALLFVIFSNSTSALPLEECMVCFDRRRNVIVLPCRHCSVCLSCLRSMRDERCPLCRILAVLRTRIGIYIYIHMHIYPYIEEQTVCKHHRHTHMIQVSKNSPMKCSHRHIGSPQRVVSRPSPLFIIWMVSWKLFPCTGKL